MNIDFKEACTYFLQDKRWKFKMLILAIIWLIPTLSPLTALMGIPLYLFSLGYTLVLTHNLINNTGSILPEFEIKKNFILGLKYTGILISYLAILFLFILGSTVPVAIITSFLGKTSFIAGITALVSISLMFSFSVFAVLIIFLSQVVFCENFSFKDAFNLKRILHIFKTNWKQYSFLFFLFICINALEIMIVKIPFIRYNQLLFIFFNELFVLFNLFLSFVFAYLYSQLFKNSLAKLG